MTPLVEARGVSMTFDGVRALAHVDFDVYPGEVHALIGENGAGKSTLIRILSGEIADYEGQLALDGRELLLSSPAEAIRAGIAVIPQELLLVSGLSAADNILLGREPARALGWIDRRTLALTAGRYLEALGEASTSADPVGRLDAGQRQLVAIARALARDARVLIMDEPTTSLGPPEVRRLERIVKELASRGVAIVYISHRLDEVRRLADRVTVLRDGCRVTTTRAADVSDRDLVRLMVGRDIERRALPPLDEHAPELLRIENVRGISMTVRRGEIVGLAGLIGAGRSEFLLALAGASDRMDGRIWLAAQKFAPADPAAAWHAGVAILPEDRQAQGVFPHLAAIDNVTIGALERVRGRAFLDRPAEMRAGGAIMQRTGVRAATPLVPVSTLSGGNQQKVLLARCLFASPSVMLLDEPTRGIDLAAKAEIADLIFDLAARGLGIVLCSSDMTEIQTLAHRIVVIRAGRVAATFAHGEATEERILTAASGPSSSTPPHPGGQNEAPPSNAPPSRRPPRDWSRFTGVLGLAAVIVLALIVSPVRNGRLVFLDVGNLTDILRQVAEKGILATGMTAVIISGGIDLSVGSVLALTATVSGLMLMHVHAGTTVTVMTALLVGALVGLINGGVTARWRVQPFIVTLATMSAARGVARFISGGAAIPLGFGAGGAPASFRTLGSTLAPNVPIPAVLFLGSVALAYALLARTRAGRYVYAIGDNEVAARLCGVQVARYKTMVYVVCGLLAGLAGVIHCAQLEQGNPNDGVAYELDAIAAVVIGGTRLSGGVGTVGGTLVGVLIIGVINNSMGLNNIDANVQLILKGAIILGAVGLQRRRG